jgi:hypothetical protein
MLYSVKHELYSVKHDRGLAGFSDGMGEQINLQREKVYGARIFSSHF